MSALSGSRSAASSNAAIAPVQSCALSAFLPALKSGSSCAQSASDAAAAMVVQIGNSSSAIAVSVRRSGPPNHGAITSRQPGGLIVWTATPAARAPSIMANAIVRIIIVSRDAAAGSRRVPLRASAILSSPRQECLSLADFLSFGISVLGEVDQLAEVLGCLLAVACCIGSACGSPVRAEPVRGLFERGLVLGQGGCRLPHLKQEVRQQFAERIEAILHRDVLETGVLAVGGCPHEPHGLVARTFLEQDPCGDGEHLFFGAVGPIGLIGALQRRPQSLHRFDFFSGAGEIAGARHAETTREAVQRIRHGILGRSDRERGGAGPVRGEVDEADRTVAAVRGGERLL